MTTKESNALIAEFMEFTETEVGWYDNEMLMPEIVYEMNTGNCFTKLLFHKSWDWLIPVIEKLQKTKIGDGIKYVDYPTIRSFGMLNRDTGKLMVRFTSFQVHEADTLIEATYKAIVHLLIYIKEHPHD